MASRVEATIRLATAVPSLVWSYLPIRFFGGRGPSPTCCPATLAWRRRWRGQAEGVKDVAHEDSMEVEVAKI